MKKDWKEEYMSLRLVAKNRLLENSGLDRLFLLISSSLMQLSTGKICLIFFIKKLNFREFG